MFLRFVQVRFLLKSCLLVLLIFMLTYITNKCIFLIDVLIFWCFLNENLFFYNSEAYREVKKEKPPFQAESPPPDEVKSIIPSDLVCALCTDLMSDAVLIPCCGESFCDDCKCLSYSDDLAQSLNCLQ